MECDHVGHRVRGRYRGTEQIEYAVSRLRRGDFLVLECGADDCYCRHLSRLRLERARR